MNITNNAGLRQLCEHVEAFIAREYSKFITLAEDQTLDCNLVIVTNPPVKKVNVKVSTKLPSTTTPAWRLRKQAQFSEQQWQEILAHDWTARIKRVLVFMHQQGGRSWKTKSIPEISSQDMVAINQKLKLNKFVFRFYHVGAVNYWSDGDIESFTVPMDQGRIC